MSDDLIQQVTRAAAAVVEPLETTVCTTTATPSMTFREYSKS
jgi:hypothetical protein